MSRPRVWMSRILALTRGARLDRGLDEELRSHLQMQIDDNLEAGMSRDEARYAALRKFGGLVPMREAYRDQRSFPVIGSVVRDIRFALRTLGRSPSFTITSIAVLGLAIGVNTAMFSVLDAVLLRPLPYPAPDQLAMLWSDDPTQNLQRGRTAYWNIEQWRKQTSSFSDIAFFDGNSATLTIADRTEKISVDRHSANLFSVLGVRPLHGRVFTEEEAAQQRRLALITHRFWQARFGGSPGAIGSTVEIDGVRSAIIGILPADFQFGDADIWQPYTMFQDWETVRRARGAGHWSVIGRLRPGIDVEKAQSEMTAIAHRLRDEMPPADRNRGIAVTPLSTVVTGPNARLALWMLSGAVFCVLLIACTNAASLSLARSASREREMAVRTALGASRGRLMGQLLVEGVSLALLAGLLGWAIAYATMQAILAFGPSDVPRLQETQMNVRVLCCAMALCFLTGILVGLFPAFAVARRSSRLAMQEGSRSVAGGIGARNVRRALVMAQYALAILLLAGAGLLIRSLWFVENVELGFKPERVLVLQLATTNVTMGPSRSAYFESVLQEVRATPGVESAGILSDLFVSSSGEPMVTVEGGGTQQLRLRSDEASSDVFQTIGAALLRGRFFSAADRAESPRVAIVNESMARRLWPDADAVGKRFKVGVASSTDPWFTVVGVIADMRREGMESEPIPQMFEALTQNQSRLVTLLVRTSVSDPMAMASAVEAAVRRVQAQIPVYGTSTLERLLGRYLARRRFQTWLLTGFSGVSLLMAAIGIYGLIQYSVAMRTREIGIRIAVGARAGEIFRMVVGEGLRLSVTGLAIGLVAAVWLGRAGSSLLFGVSSTDPLTFVSVSVLLLTVAVAACCFPARRAMKVEPVIALRQD